jgi:hypothetical protein
MSGRALRRLPVLALARYVGIGNVNFSRPLSSNATGLNLEAPIAVWLDGLEMAVHEQGKEKDNLN